MGNCLTTCLGRGRSEAIDEAEDERLLFDDPNAMHYGSFGDQMPSTQDDSVEAQREMESLQRVVAKTADNMVDIYEIAPQRNNPRAPPTPFAYAGQGERVARYQHLAAKLSTEDDATTVQVDWMPAQQDGSLGSAQGIQALNLPDKPLVGTFADAAAAMA